MQSANHGDVIKANHLLHAHYGVYVKTSRGPRVIHYTNAESRSRLKGPVSETSVEDFLDGAEGFKVCRFDPARYPRLHSGEETVRRAPERVRGQEPRLQPLRRRAGADGLPGLVGLAAGAWERHQRGHRRRDHRDPGLEGGPPLRRRRVASGLGKRSITNRRPLWGAHWALWVGAFFVSARSGQAAGPALCIRPRGRV